MKKSLLIACLCVIALTISTSSQAKIYKWTDKKGVIHYSATPPQTKQKAKNIEDKIRFAAGKYTPKKVTSSTQRTASGKKVKKLSSKLSSPNKKLTAYCQGQRSNLSKLKSNYRNTWIENGVKKNLDQSQRKQKVQQLIDSIELNCNEV